MTVLRTFVRLLALLVLCVSAAGLWASTPAPDAVVICDYPQALASFQSFGSAIYAYSRAGVAWNGREYGMAYADQANVYFRRYYADGTPAAAARTVAVSGWTGGSLCTPILWTGTGYAIGYSTNYQVFLVVVDTNGNVVFGPTAASTNSSTWKGSVSLASSGTAIAAVWTDQRSGNYDIYATHFNLDATIGGSGAYHDIAVTTATNTQQYASVAWSPAGFYIVTWEDFRTGTKWEVYDARLSTNGAVMNETALVSSTGGSYKPRIVAVSGTFGLAWQDSRDGNYEIYFARLDSTAAKTGSDLRVTNNSSSSAVPDLVWTGGEYGLFWADNTSGTWEIYFQRVSAAGAVLGSPLQLMAGTGVTWPAAGFASHGYLVAASNQNGSYPGFLQPLGCYYPSTPPCPENALAYNISGTQATLAWLPVVDPYFDVAYYQVYRNNSLVTTTSSNVYTDTGLASGVTYGYSIRAVNANGQVSTACSTGSSVYVKANASLLLRVDKSTPDAALTWSDAGMNTYKVYRGTSPQVMQEIGATSGLLYEDPNVLTDAVLYFYTVDDPGQ